MAKSRLFDRGEEIVLFMGWLLELLKLGLNDDVCWKVWKLCGGGGRSTGGGGNSRSFSAIVAPRLGPIDSCSNEPCWPILVS